MSDAKSARHLNRFNYLLKEEVFPNAMNLTQRTKIKYLPLHSSGLETIDTAWGGLYRGGAYLYYGEAVAGRSLLTLLCARAGDVLEEQTVFISADRYSELKIQSGALGFSLEAVLEKGNLHLVRIPPRIKLREMGDDGVAQALHNLTAPFKSYEPKRLVINDFMPFVAFRSFERFRIEFVRFLDLADSLSATIILAMSEPANDHSRRVIDFMISHMTGAVHIERNKEELNSTIRKLTLIPTSGHIKGYVFEHWDLESIVTQSAPVSMPSLLDKSLPWDLPTVEVAVPDSSERSSSEVQVAAQEAHLDPDPDTELRAIPKPGYSHTRLVSPVPFREEESEMPSEVSPDLPKEVLPSSEVPPPDVSIPDSSRPISHTNLPVGSGLDIDITDRVAYLARLDRAIALSVESGDDYVVLALRMKLGGDPEERAIGFEFLLDMVHDTLQPHDDMLVDMEGEQLTVFLAHTREMESDRFFATLKDHLIRESPQKGLELLSQISAVVSENGRPFASAEEFVTYAFLRD